MDIHPNLDTISILIIIRDILLLYTQRFLSYIVLQNH